jgi:8-oxo-dGTP pyrophosphatase MutT (NUDIX family)
MSTEELSVLVAREHNILKFIGTKPALEAHRLGEPHATVQLIAVRWEEGGAQLLIHRRSPHKRTSPDSWDFCGGHLVYEEKYREGDGYNLSRAYDEGAWREAAEEIHIQPCPCNSCGASTMQHIMLPPASFFRFKGVGYFECRSKIIGGLNVEYSTAYLVAIPNGHEVKVYDTVQIDGKEVNEKLHHEWLTVEQLMQRFRDERIKFADGAERILKRLEAEEGLLREFEIAIDYTAAISRDLSG